MYRSMGTALLYFQAEKVPHPIVHSIHSPREFISSMQRALAEPKSIAIDGSAVPSTRTFLNAGQVNVATYLHSMAISTRMVHVERNLSDDVGMRRPFRSRCGQLFRGQTNGQKEKGFHGEGYAAQSGLPWTQDEVQSGQRRYAACFRTGRCQSVMADCERSDECHPEHMELCGGSFFLVPQTDYLRGLETLPRHVEVHALCLPRLGADWARFAARHGVDARNAEGPQGRASPMGQAYHQHVERAASSNLTFQQRHQAENPKLKDEFFLTPDQADFVRGCLFPADDALFASFCGSATTGTSVWTRPSHRANADTNGAT